MEEHAFLLVQGWTFQLVAQLVEARGNYIVPVVSFSSPVPRLLGTLKCRLLRGDRCRLGNSGKFFRCRWLSSTRGRHSNGGHAPDRNRLVGYRHRRWQKQWAVFLHHLCVVGRAVSASLERSLLSLCRLPSSDWRSGKLKLKPFRSSPQANAFLCHQTHAPSH